MGTTQLDLGNEAVRYAAFAAADREFVRQEGGYPSLPPAGLSPRGEHIIASLDEWIDSDIAVATGPEGSPDPDATRRAIEVIDAIPVTMRVEIAQNLLDKIREAELAGHAVSGIRQLLPTHDRLLFLFDQAANWSDPKHFEAHVFAYTAVRHEELNALYSPGASLMLARMSTEGRQVIRSFVLIEGDVAELDIPSEVRWSILDGHGVLTGDGARPTESLRRNDRCPCRSGKKYKQCHLPR